MGWFRKQVCRPISPGAASFISTVESVIACSNSVEYTEISKCKGRFERMRKRQRCRRVSCVIPALALVFVMFFSMIPSIQASAAGDDVFYMTVSGTMRYDYANEVANLTNQQRMANGQAPLQMDSELTERAMLRAREITRIFSHTRPNGESYASVLDGSRFEYAASGENIAKGWPAQYFTPSVVITGWMNSDGHRANILRSNYQTIGVVVAVDAS